MTLTKEDIIKNIEFKGCLNERTKSDILNFIINELNNNDTEENTKLFLEKLTLHIDLIQTLLTRISVASITICLAVFLKTNRTSLNCTLLVCACLAVIFAQAALFSEGRALILSATFLLYARMLYGKKIQAHHTQ